jgi:hypothetical protein
LTRLRANHRGRGGEERGKQRQTQILFEDDKKRGKSKGRRRSSSRMTKKTGNGKSEGETEAIR